MKIETSPIFELIEVVALRSKSYSYSYGAKDPHYTKTDYKQKGNPKCSQLECV